MYNIQIDTTSEISTTEIYYDNNRVDTISIIPDSGFVTIEVVGKDITDDNKILDY